jgi:hypothetical protein
MNASEALNLTHEALDGQTGMISAAIQAAFAIIREGAAKGERSVANPVRGLAGKPKQAAYERLKSLGYQTSRSSGQRDGDEWTVSW